MRFFSLGSCQFEQTDRCDSSQMQSGFNDSAYYDMSGCQPTIKNPQSIISFARFDSNLVLDVRAPLLSTLRVERADGPFKKGASLWK